MNITEKIDFLKRYTSETQFSHKVKLMLKDEKYLIASECARVLNFSKQYFAECPDKHIEGFVQFGLRKYYKLRKKV